MNVDVTNPKLDSAQKVILSWDSMDKVRKGKVSARILTSKNVSDFNDFGKKAKVAPAEFKDYKITDEGIEINIPAASIVSFAIK